MVARSEPFSPVVIQPPPGVVLTESERIIEGRWQAPFNNARFVRGMVQKLGGNTVITTTPSPDPQRTLFGWFDLTQDKFIAAGTFRKLYVYDVSFAQNDITPFRATGTLTNPFSTQISSPVVTVSQTSHGCSPGDTVIFSGSSAVGGITPNGTFVVTTVPDANHFTFNFTSNATSTAGPGGGTVTFQYEISVGNTIATAGLGWGVGGWGLSTWGTARAGTPVVLTEARIWALDNFGKFLIATYNTGLLYTFDPSVAQPWPRAQVIANAPLNVRSTFVTPEEFVFALLEGMTVASCSQGDFNTWTPATNNTAFSRTLAIGSKLIAGRVLAPFQSAVWSDAAMYMFQYTGDQFIYKSSMVGRDCGLIGPNAVVTVNGAAFWMGNDNFLMFDGSVHPMPNVEDVRAFVFDNLDKTQGFLSCAAYNPKYMEIVFFYCTTGQTSPGQAVVFSMIDQVWYPWTTNRLSGTHFTYADTRPYMADSVTGLIYQHEVGYDDNGNPLDMLVTLAPYAFHEGRVAMDVEGIVFDDFHQSGNLTITVNGFDRLTDVGTSDVDTEIITATQAGLTDLRIAGRYVGMTIESNVLAGYFRWGHPAAFVRPSGQRR